MTPEERRALLGDDVIEHCREVAAETTVWTPELIADLAVILRRARSSDTEHDTAA